MKYGLDCRFTTAALLVVFKVQMKEANKLSNVGGGKNSYWSGEHHSPQEQGAGTRP